MKTFKKIALVSAIAAAPFAAQAMESMDDSALGNTTGQAGVTVELTIGEAGISVGEIAYTDTAHDVTTVDDKGTTDTSDDVDVITSTDGGSVAMQNLVIKNINGLTQTIDISSTGDLVIGMTAVDDISIALGGRNAKGESTSAVVLQDATHTATQAELVNNLNLTVDLGVSTTTIYNMGNQVITGGIAASADYEAVTTVSAAGDITLTAGQAAAINAAGGSVAAGDIYTVTAGDPLVSIQQGTAAIAEADTAGMLGAAGVIGAHAQDVSSIAIGMAAEFRLDDLDVGVFGYTEAQAKVSAQANAGVIAAKTALVGAAAGTISYDADGVASSTNSADDTVVATYNTTLAGTVAAIADGAAINITDMSFTGENGGMVSIEQTIWAKGGSAANGGGVYMQIGEIAGTMNIGGIAIGGASIGSVSVSDINLAGMTTRIYGH